jgi:hypothetical protein
MILVSGLFGTTEEAQEQVVCFCVLEFFGIASEAWEA